MNSIIKCREDLISYIKDVILKYCPYTEDRLLILGTAKSPELDIIININNNESQIMFMFGNSAFKSSVSEQATVSYIISFEEIGDIIDFILDDHKEIKNINFYDKELDLKFAINWTDKSIKGINCSDIGLNLNFENMEVKKQYSYLLFQRYYFHLEQAPTFKAMKSKYIDSMKYSYFDSLDKVELITILNKMSENDLKNLLYNLDNDLFIKYAMSDLGKSKVRVLSLDDNN
ncbi:MAG: hypothetical protein IJ715_00910 [Bacilli bacterium]|nr:hypothetical protein [Bacilli bacterium]